LLLAVVVGASVAACSDDALTSRVCEPDRLQCLGEASVEIRRCSPDGKEWMESTCLENQRCFPQGSCDPAAGWCDGQCENLNCIPNQRSCHANGIYVVECDALGAERCYVANCAAPPINGVCVDGQCVAVCSAIAKSYLGCEYFGVDLDNAFVYCSGDPNGQFCDAAGQQYAVLLSNPDQSHRAHVLVTTGDVAETYSPDGCSSPPPHENFVMAASIPPSGSIPFPLPRRDADATVLARLAYRIASNTPITVYQFNPLENVNVYSNDASLLLPTTAAGKRYFVMTRTQLSDELRGFLTVVGIDDRPTTVTITASSPTGGGEDRVNGGFIPALQTGEVLTVTLDKYDVLNLETNERGSDLTGSLIEADRPVIVYGGHEAGNAPTPDWRCNTTTNTCIRDPSIACGCAPGDTNCDPDTPCYDIPCCADHLEQQIFPTTALGREYLAVRSWQRGREPDVWRILAAENATEITLDPPVAAVPTLESGRWFEFESDVDFRISATKPILVGQFLVGENYRGAAVGDPAFVLAVPTRQYRQGYVFLAPDKYEEDYVSIATPQGAPALLDDVEARSMPLARVSTIAAVGSVVWEAIRVPIADGIHWLDCADGCGVMVHGYDQYVSYAYPGGLNLFECASDVDCPDDRPVCDGFACVVGP